MVLQRGIHLPVWGWSDPGAKVTVTFAGQSVTAKAGADGRWRVKLEKLEASREPRTLTVESGDKLTLTNILVGDVWLASGQSNMEKPLGLQPGQKPCFNYQQDLAAANHPLIRLFKVEKTLAATPQTDFSKYVTWTQCDSNSLDRAHFSAAAYYFGMELQTNLGVPIGLVESSWGGTRIEPWTAPEGFRQVPALKELADRTPGAGTDKVKSTDAIALYNAMIAPMVGFGIRGAIWYQGESNLRDLENAHGVTYDVKMQALVNGWRQVWGEGPFPFYFVQIAPFKYFSGKTKRANDVEELPEFWTIQSRAVREIPNTGMAVTTDLVDDLNDIHPRDKADVGHRLALLARHHTYGQEVTSRGPALAKCQFQGDKAVVEFKHAKDGLTTRDMLPPNWFTIAGADGKFVPARARIDGDSVELWAPEVANPKYVRFAWSELAQPNLMNSAGLPAEAFRSDEPNGPVPPPELGKVSKEKK